MKEANKSLAAIKFAVANTNEQYREVNFLEMTAHAKTCKNVIYLLTSSGLAHVQVMFSGTAWIPAYPRPVVHEAWFAKATELADYLNHNK